METAMWRVVGRWAQRADGEWYEVVTYAEPLALWSPGGNTPFEAAEKWAASGPWGRLGLEAFLRVRYPATHGPVDVFVKIKPRMAYDCEHVDISGWKFAE